MNVKRSNHEFLLRQLKVGETSRKDGRMVLRHGRTCAQKCVERYCELANKTQSNKTKFQLPAWMVTTSSKKEVGSVGELSKVTIIEPCLNPEFSAAATEKSTKLGNSEYF